MTDMWSIKETIQRATLSIPKGIKNAVSISIAFSLDVLIRNENITFEERKTKNRSKQSCMWSELQAFKVGWLIQSKKFSIFDYPSNFEGL